MPTTGCIVVAAPLYNRWDDLATAFIRLWNLVQVLLWSTICCMHIFSMQERTGAKRISLVCGWRQCPLPIRRHVDSPSLHGAEAWRVSNALTSDARASGTWRSVAQHVGSGAPSQLGSEEYHVPRSGDPTLFARVGIGRLIQCTLFCLVHQARSD